MADLEADGQLTLPEEIRLHLALREGDWIAFLVDEDGSVVLQRDERRYPTIDSLAGAAGTLPQPLSSAEIKEIAAEERAKEVYEKLRRSQ